jgi:hypothetical protein
MDLFCTSIDSLRGTVIDQTVPPDSSWSSRPRSSVVGGGTTTTNERREWKEDMRSTCRRGIPPSLRRASWIINVVSAANPDMSESDCDDYGTFRKARVIGEKRNVPCIVSLLAVRCIFHRPG